MGETHLKLLHPFTENLEKGHGKKTNAENIVILRSRVREIIT